MNDFLQNLDSNHYLVQGAARERVIKNQTEFSSSAVVVSSFLKGGGKKGSLNSLTGDPITKNSSLVETPFCKTDSPVQNFCMIKGLLALLLPNKLSFSMECHLR